MDTLRAPHPLHASRDIDLREQSPRELAKARHRQRWIVATAIMAGLLLCAAALGWFANRLADDLTATIQPIPALADQQHRSD